jgi:hypothetical protein
LLTLKPAVAPKNTSSISDGKELQMPHHFAPNRMLLQQRGQLKSAEAEQGQTRYLGISYQGKLNSTTQLSQVQNLPDDDNCALWITNIPPKAEHSAFFKKIKTGEVVSLHLNIPDEDHEMGAASLVFKTHEGAARFLEQSTSGEGIWIRGKRLDVRYNRNGCRAYSLPRSRVLQIEQAESGMDIEQWKNYFSKFCVYQLEFAGEFSSNVEGRKVTEFRFARIDGQAQTCYDAIKTDPQFKNILRLRYAYDPCLGSSK